MARKFSRKITGLLIILSVSSCIAVPINDNKYINRCSISSDRKTLKIIDVAKETNSYYSVSGLLLTPILVPATAIISGSYVLVNNIYHLGNESIECEKNK
ncbi:MAG: hypothetical protein IMY67_05045 [Bacteroidetes bacterium]|nr:hypothetical protein [Bacteroidota bacterium]